MREFNIAILAGEPALGGSLQNRSDPKWGRKEAFAEQINGLWNRNRTVSFGEAARAAIAGVRIALRASLVLRVMRQWRSILHAVYRDIGIYRCTSAVPR